MKEIKKNWIPCIVFYSIAILSLAAIILLSIFCKFSLLDSATMWVPIMQIILLFIGVSCMLFGVVYLSFPPEKEIEVEHE